MRRKATRGREPMIRKLGADAPAIAVQGNARAYKVETRSRGAPAFVGSYALMKAASCNPGRRSTGLINLERRARFARIDAV